MNKLSFKSQMPIRPGKLLRERDINLGCSNRGLFKTKSIKMHKSTPSPTQYYFNATREECGRLLFGVYDVVPMVLILGPMNDMMKFIRAPPIVCFVISPLWVEYKLQISRASCACCSWYKGLELVTKANLIHEHPSTTTQSTLPRPFNVCSPLRPYILE